MGKTNRKRAYRKVQPRQVTAEERRQMRVIVVMEPWWTKARAVYVTGGSNAHLCGHRITDPSDHGDALCFDCGAELWAPEWVDHTAIPNAEAWSAMRQAGLDHAAMSRTVQ